jgi:hypothetical protein
MEIIDWSRIKYRIDGIPVTDPVCDRFPDLKAHRGQFMGYDIKLPGIPEGYDPCDFLLRYLILTDAPGSPAEHIPDPAEKKAWVLKQLGVKSVGTEILAIATHKNLQFRIRRVLFLRLQYNEFYRFLKQLEAELTSLEESEIPSDEREAKSRQDRMKGLMNNMVEVKNQLFRGDTSKVIEETLMALVVNENLGLRPEEIAAQLAKGIDPLEGVSILANPELDNL